MARRFILGLTMALAGGSIIIASLAAAELGSSEPLGLLLFGVAPGVIVVVLAIATFLPTPVADWVDEASRRADLEVTFWFWVGLAALAWFAFRLARVAWGG